MGNVVGMALSLLYVLGVLGASSLLSRRGASAEATRKLVHIALGGWWVIAASFFTSLWWAAALPAAFVAVNAWAYRTRSLAFMARDGGEDTPGTVYYAVSLTLLALFSFGIGASYVGALGVFCMAFGDGLAAVAGRRFGRRMIAVAGGGKSVVGSAVMFGASLASCAAVLLVASPLGTGAALAAALGLAAAATLLELLSPAGLDNLAVPLGVSGLYALLALPAGWYTPMLAGLLLSGAVAVASLRLGLLTVPGGIGAAAVGMLAFAVGGWPLWLLLMWFFGSSNIAAKVATRWARGRGRAAGRKGGTGATAGAGGAATAPTAGDGAAAATAGTIAAAGGVQAAAPAGGRARRRRGEPRRLRQVLANSVPFLACALAYAATGEVWLLVVSAGALAASTADTWASEIGVHSKDPPVNLLTRRPMQRGLSGGVSPLGLAATVAGAATSAVLATVLFPAFGFAVPAGPVPLLFITACGVTGSLVDSLLGVALQAKYRAPGDGTLVEAAPRAARGYTLVSGYSWVTNDAVNLMSGIAVVALGLLVAA